MRKTSVRCFAMSSPFTCSPLAARSARSKYARAFSGISEAGFAKVAGVELTLLDCARYLHRAAGINGVAQIAKELGGKANPRGLAKLADVYENSSVRRLGYLLELSGHMRQAKALERFARLFADLRATGGASLSMLLVIVREMAVLERA